MKTKIIYRKPLGNPDRKYRQSEFIISSYMSLYEGFEEGVGDLRLCIQNVKELGCNLTEFLWSPPEMTERCILACEEFGIDGVFQNWDAFGGFQASKGIMKCNMEKLKEFMEFSKKYKHFYGYYVWDEPLSKEAVNAAGEQVNEIEALDSERLPQTIAIPSYNATDTWKNGKYESYLKRYVRVINPAVLTLDYYPFNATRPVPFNQLDASELFLDIALLRELSLEKKIPMWFCIQAQDSPMGEKYYRFTPEKLMMQAYNVLLHGAKGVQYYCPVEGAIYRDGRKGPLFFQMQALNERLRQWGKTLMALTSVGVFHSPELLKDNWNFERFRQPIADSQILADEELPFRCSVGELEDCEGNRYLIILNRDYQNANKFKLNLKQPYRVYEVSGVDGTQFVRHKKIQKLSVELSPGDAVFLRFQEPEKEAYLIDYLLKDEEKGA